MRPVRPAVTLAVPMRPVRPAVTLPGIVFHAVPVFEPAGADIRRIEGWMLGLVASGTLPQSGGRSGRRSAKASARSSAGG